MYGRLGQWLDHDAHIACLGQRAHLARALRHDLVEIHRIATHGQLTGIRAREEEQIIDDSAQPSRRLAHDDERVLILRGIASRARKCEARFVLYDRHWGAQLVRRIGHELALLRERALEPREQSR